MRLQILEHEPAEALELLAADDIDLALTYDYDLAPAGFDAGRWRRCRCGRPTGAWASRAATRRRPATSAAVLGRYRDSDWIVNSRNNADDRGGPHGRLDGGLRARGSRTAPTASSWSRT